MSRRTTLVFLAIAPFAALTIAQQVGEGAQEAEPASILVNASQQAVAVEVHLGETWQELKIEGGQEGRAVGDRVRMATRRRDNATVTVDYPLEPGKKYRVFFNPSAGVWDFAPME